MKKILELEFEPVQKFIKKLGRDIDRYFGKDPACIIYLQPHGVFYATALFEWMSKKKKNVVLIHMEDGGENLQKEKVRGRKVLIVDGDIITGKAYKRSMEALRIKKETLEIKDIKFATYVDRGGLADFSVWDYSAEATWRSVDLDAVDLKIISFLKEDGRMSFTEIGKRIKISGVAVKNRVEWLFKKKILGVKGILFMDKFYSLSAAFQIDAEQGAISKLIEKLENAPEIYHLVKRSGNYNLAVGFLARDVESIGNFVEKEIRSVPGIRSIDIRIGELPIIPKTFYPHS